MNEKLNRSKIDYLFYHLNLHFVLTNKILESINFELSSSQQNSQIIFPLSSKGLENIKYIDDIPILFPLNDEKKHFKIDENKNLIFNDDILKSAFYLLSGFQEFNTTPTGIYERFSYQQSIQKQLGIIKFPLVNHYFQIIIEGIEQFCIANKIEFEKRSYWNDKKFGFLLTHDIDRVDKYTIREIKLKIKQLSGFSKSKLNKKQTAKLLLKYISKFFSSENPYWNFDWMKSIENKYGFKSIWFFLPQGDKNIDAYYSFNENRIKNLVSQLSDYGDEIGLHSTYFSINDEKVLKDNFESVKYLIGKSPTGNRQHWLRIKHPETLINLEKLGIEYDSSLGFFDNIGWRNSYSLPFKPYDFENDRMINVWELPLTVMDITLFEYQNLDLSAAKNEIDEIINVCEKYGGLFTLLWHNSNFDESINPGITNFYENILKSLNQMNIQNITGKEIISKLKQIDFQNIN
ncbi:MAG: polysaccharide deacetylase family protein [Ignavibacteriales bacterium]|nr:polysaccharide deacetylase family protein [Ignavibacteriales bacterium]